LLEKNRRTREEIMDLLSNSEVEGDQ